MRTELKAMPGVVQVLENMTLPYAVVTNSDADDLEVKLEVTGLARFFPPKFRFDTQTMALSNPYPAIYYRWYGTITLISINLLVSTKCFPGCPPAFEAGTLVW